MLPAMATSLLPWTRPVSVYPRRGAPVCARMLNTVAVKSCQPSGLSWLAWWAARYNRNLTTRIARPALN